MGHVNWGSVGYFCAYIVLGWALGYTGLSIGNGLASMSKTRLLSVLKGVGSLIVIGVVLGSGEISPTFGVKCWIVLCIPLLYGTVWAKLDTQSSL